MNQLQKLFSWLKHAAAHSPKSHTFDGRQLRLVAYPVIYGGFLHPRWLFVISSINSITNTAAFLLAAFH